MWVHKWMNKMMNRYLWKVSILKINDFLFQGDSGSPLICDNIFRGVTSFGKCGNPQKPGIYILLSKKHLNWIKKTIAGAIWHSFFIITCWCQGGFNLICPRKHLRTLSAVCTNKSLSEIRSAMIETTSCFHSYMMSKN